MLNTGKLAGQTLFITGASRGIGKAIALKAAKDGANITIAAKTAEPHSKLPGTIYSAAKEVEEAGGKCLPCVVDIRDEEQVKSAVENTVKEFGGIDILVNNASAINLTGTLETSMKKYDLMHNINTRGTYVASKHCIPYLKKSSNPHILNLSPPLNFQPRWFKDHVAYTMAKYGMSLCVLGMTEELRPFKIAVNALWPKTAIITAAMEMLGGNEIDKNCRKPEIVADAAYAILTRKSDSFTGNFCIDEHILKEAGVTDMDQYAVSPGHPLLPDFFLSDDDLKTFDSISDVTIENLKQPGGEKSSGKVFSKIEGLLSEDIVKSTGGVFVFDITGDPKETWYIDLKNGSGSVGKGDPPVNGDVTFTVDPESFTQMFTGSLKPTAAFMSGKLKIKGNMGLALKLDNLMSKVKSKL
ncbi:hydroxysteroid dehydrogenase like 2 [Tachypleus tridentatus]|uniref:hydroxysteroid dehydrogenase like 2 n=1 Tax=Tachypleus tridentatus TaxID=6853 RepID=UPI003FD05894